MNIINDILMKLKPLSPGCKARLNEIKKIEAGRKKALFHIDEYEHYLTVVYKSGGEHSWEKFNNWQEFFDWKEELKRAERLRKEREGK